MIVSFWDLVVDRISRRLDGRKKAHLFLGLGGGGVEDNFNLVLFIPHPNIFPLFLRSHHQ